VLWIIWIILWNAIGCCFWLLMWDSSNIFFDIIGRGRLLSLLSFSSYCCVWQHHHCSFNYFYASHKWHYVIFKVDVPLLLKVLSTSKVIWYLDIFLYVYVHVYPPLSISLCLYLYVILFVFWYFLTFFGGFLNNLL
jgi:hypothetical protein